MKYITLFALVSLLFVGQAQAAVDMSMDPTPKVVAVNMSDVLMPSTVRANEDNVKIVVSGLFQNGCYAFEKIDYRTAGDGFTHQVRTLATVSPGLCIMVLVPFTKEFNVGKLEAGQHVFRFYNGDETYIEKRVQAL
jgi:hypothetical protein